MSDLLTNWWCTCICLMSSRPSGIECAEEENEEVVAKQTAFNAPHSESSQSSISTSSSSSSAVTRLITMALIRRVALLNYCTFNDFATKRLRTTRGSALGYCRHSAPSREKAAQTKAPERSLCAGNR